jgi:hypothetical protein
MEPAISAGSLIDRKETASGDANFAVSFCMCWHLYAMTMGNIVGWVKDSHV